MSPRRVISELTHPEKYLKSSQLALLKPRLAGLFKAVSKVLFSFGAQELGETIEVEKSSSKIADLLFEGLQKINLVMRHKPQKAKILEYDFAKYRVG